MTNAVTGSELSLTWKNAPKDSGTESGEFGEILRQTVSEGKQPDRMSGAEGKPGSGVPEEDALASEMQDALERNGWALAGNFYFAVNPGFLNQTADGTEEGSAAVGLSGQQAATELLNGTESAGVQMEAVQTEGSELFSETPLMQEQMPAASEGAGADAAQAVSDGAEGPAGQSEETDGMTKNLQDELPEAEEKTGNPDSSEQSVPDASGAVEGRAELTEAGRPKEAGQAAPPADTARAERAEEPATMEQLPQRILEGISEGKREMEVSLEPEALGKLTIRATYEDGRAMVSIVCSNPKTAELLSAHANSLGMILETNLGSPTEIQLEQPAQENAGENAADAYNGNGRGDGRQESRRRKQESGESFLQQLRLGLV